MIQADIPQQADIFHRFPGGFPQPRRPRTPSPGEPVEIGLSAAAILTGTTNPHRVSIETTDKPNSSHGNGCLIKENHASRSGAWL